MVPDSGLCLKTGVGCVTSVEIGDCSHHLIKSHISNFLNPTKVTDNTSSPRVAESYLVALSTMRSMCPRAAGQAHTSTPSSQRLCAHLRWAGGAAWPCWPTAAALSRCPRRRTQTKGLVTWMLGASSNDVNCGHWKLCVSHHVCHNCYTF